MASSVTAQNVVLQEPLIASENIIKNLCIDNVDTGVQEELVEQNSAVTADSIVDVGVQDVPIVQNIAVDVDKVE